MPRRGCPYVVDFRSRARFRARSVAAVEVVDEGVVGSVTTFAGVSEPPPVELIDWAAATGSLRKSDSVPSGANAGVGNRFAAGDGALSLPAGGRAGTSPTRRTSW